MYLPNLPVEPSSLQSFIINEFHRENHFGVDKTYIQLIEEKVLLAQHVYVPKKLHRGISDVFAMQS